MAKSTLEDNKLKLLKALKKSKKALSPKAAIEITGLSKAELTAAGKALMDENLIRFAGAKNELIELVPADEKKASKKKADPPAKKVKRKVEEDDDDDDDEEDEEDDEDEDEEDWDDDEEDEDEDPDEDEDDEDEDEDDDEEEDEDDDDEDDEDDEDEDEDDEDDDPPARKVKSKVKSAPAKKSAKKASAPKKPEKVKKSAEFTMAFKTIDALTVKELKARLEDGLEAAEELFNEGHKNVAELIMRSLSKVKKQLAKREED